jgi:hypothetical protein
MASESRGPSVTVSLPPELEQWLDEQARDLGTDRETVLLQLLSSYRAAEDLGDDIGTVEGDDALLAPDDVEPIVRDVLTDRLPDLTDAVADRVADDLHEELTAEITEAVREDLESGPDADLAARIDDLEAQYREDLDDVREKVIRVKRDADSKAPAGHGHDEFERIEAIEADLDRLERRADQHADLGDRVADLSSELDGVESRLDALRSDLEDVDTDRIDDIESDLSDAEEKLTTVAYVVRDLRDAVSGGTTGRDTLDRIKQEAAAADVGRAACANCGEGVRIGLLTEPSCPHCEATLDGVEPPKRRFGLGSATLSTAASLESGVAADPGDELDDIDTDAGGETR